MSFNPSAKHKSGVKRFVAFCIRAAHGKQNRDLYKSSLRVPDSLFRQLSLICEFRTLRSKGHIELIKQYKGTKFALRRNLAANATPKTISHGKRKHLV